MHHSLARRLGALANHMSIVQTPCKLDTMFKGRLCFDFNNNLGGSAHLLEMLIWILGGLPPCNIHLHHSVVCHVGVKAEHMSIK